MRGSLHQNGHHGQRQVSVSWICATPEEQVSPRYTRHWFISEKNGLNVSAMFCLTSPIKAKTSCSERNSEIKIIIRLTTVTAACQWSENFLSPSSFRYGDGYTIILRIADAQSHMDSCPVSTYMKSCFPSVELKERHHNVLQYQLPSRACCLARVFDVLANNHEELGIIDFSVSQTTLDQVRAKMQQWKSALAQACFCKRVISSGSLTFFYPSLISKCQLL